MVYQTMSLHLHTKLAIRLCWQDNLAPESIGEGSEPTAPYLRVCLSACIESQTVGAVALSVEACLLRPETVGPHLIKGLHTKWPSRTRLQIVINIGSKQGCRKGIFS